MNSKLIDKIAKLSDERVRERYHVKYHIADTFDVLKNHQVDETTLNDVYPNFRLRGWKDLNHKIPCFDTWTDGDRTRRDAREVLIKDFGIIFGPAPRDPRNPHLEGHPVLACYIGFNSEFSSWRPPTVTLEFLHRDDLDMLPYFEVEMGRITIPGGHDTRHQWVAFKPSEEGLADRNPVIRVGIDDGLLNGPITNRDIDRLRRDRVT